MRAGPISSVKDWSTRDAVAIWIALALALAYLVFAGSLSVNEGLATLVCATLGTAWWWVAGRRGGVRFRFDGAVLRNQRRQRLDHAFIGAGAAIDAVHA